MSSTTSSSSDEHGHVNGYEPATVLVGLNWIEATDTTEYYIEPSDVNLCPHCTTHILLLNNCCRGEGIEHVESMANLEVLPEHVIDTITEIEVYGKWQDAVEFTLCNARDMPMLKLISFHSYDNTYPMSYPEGLQIDGVSAAELTVEDPFDGPRQIHQSLYHALGDMLFELYELVGEKGVEFAMKVWFTFEEKRVGYAVLRWEDNKMVLDDLELEDAQETREEEGGDVEGERQTAE
ncbi:hypothetical protein EDD37DRAFT_493902 [Exophiala viscosa]|uniref:uncharacterized protein n=1 Tax=Exophiala viscosa TaxID=2486360 RepID=UPI0021A0CB9B|nr:hypothetical protein EDD37DRAFT_493902 [Exophiala viscosa]